MNGWQIFSTNGAHGYDLHRKCIDSWKGYYSEMFCWLNGEVCEDRLRSYIVDNASACLTSRKSYNRVPWGKFIRQIPLSVAEVLKTLGRVDFKDCDYIMQFDGDERMPVHPGFRDYFNSWLGSDSPAMLCNFIYPWGSDKELRVDHFATQESHGFFFRVGENGFSWLPYRGRGCPKRIKFKDCWECPYPVVHYNHITEKVRYNYLKHKRDGITYLSLADSSRPTHYQVYPQRVVLYPMRSDITVKEILAMQDDIKKGRLPNGCREEGY